MNVGAGLSFGAAMLVLAIVTARFPRVWLVSVLLGTAAGLAVAAGGWSGSPAWEWTSAFRLGGEFAHLRLDGLSALFLGLVALIGGAGAVYASEYWSDREHPRSAPRGRMWWAAFVLSLGAVLLMSNGLHFLIAWEAFALCGYFLITLESRRREVRAAGWLYLAASHAGTLGLFALFSVIAARTGRWELGAHLREQTALEPWFWLVLGGFGVKAGLFPLHIWLPSAHASAPSHVSAMLSGVSLKIGVYGMLRLSGWLPVPDSAGLVVLGVGAVAALLGIAFALAQTDIKRLLAYSSIENIGVIMIGFGAALLGAAQADAAWGRLALAGALLHVWNHGLFKSLLFFGAGSVLHATGTREMSRLGGLWSRMPWTAACFAVGAIAVSSLPPLNGFVSEWLVYLGLFDAVTLRGSLAWSAALAALALAMTGALALASFVKAGAIVFLGAPRTKIARNAHECGPRMRGAMLVLALGCVGIGLAPMLVWPAIARAVAVWNPAWDAAAVPAPLGGLGYAHVALAAVGAFALAGLWWRSRTTGVRRGPTWDCGYARPTPRMQYTGGSFAGIAAGWFFWILRPERALQRPRGVWPAGARQVERVPETVLERVIAPAGAMVLRVSTAVRRLQHGRLQSYIVYLVAGLLVVAAVVAIGGWS